MNVKVIVNEKGTAKAEKLFFILLHGFQQILKYEQMKMT